MIRTRLQDRRVILGVFVVLIAVSLVLWFNRDRAPEPAAQGLESAEALADAQNQAGEQSKVATSTPPPTASKAFSATSTPQASPTASVTPTSRPSPSAQPTASAAVASISSPTADLAAGEAATPTATATPQPTSTPQPTRTRQPTNPPTSTSTPHPLDCLDATYMADVTIPDNSHLEKGESFVKTWRVRNSGSCSWPEDTQLVFVSGNQMSAPNGITIGALEVGAALEISIEMVAPNVDDTVQGRWQFATGIGDEFGTWLTVVIRVGELPTPAPTATPNPAAPAPPPPPPSPGRGFELGGHIRTWNYVPQMQYAGMTWAKVQVHFGQDASGLVQTAHNLGFKIQLSALGSPGMVTQPNFHADYTAWVAGLAAAGADAIEVWNEPNIDREWQVGQISPASYTQLLCASYSAIKGANPGTAVISAAPAPTGWFGGCSANGCDDQPWMEGLYNAGAANCMDYLGAHHNSGATSPSARSGHPADPASTHHSWFFLPQTELYYNIFRGTRQLFYTEMGYASQEGVPTFSDQFGWARGTNNAQQAAWLAEAVSLSRSTGMVRNIIVWNIDFVRYGYDPQDGYAIIRPDGSCPACETLRAATQ